MRTRREDQGYAAFNKTTGAIGAGEGVGWFISDGRDQVIEKIRRSINDPRAFVVVPVRIVQRAIRSRRAKS